MGTGCGGGAAEWIGVIGTVGIGSEIQREREIRKRNSRVLVAAAVAAAARVGVVGVVGELGSSAESRVDEARRRRPPSLTLSLSLSTPETGATGPGQVQHPLEPLLRKLIKGYVDEDDLNNKLVGLFEVRGTDTGLKGVGDWAEEGAVEKR